MRIFTKAILREDQIKQRAKLHHVDGIEVYLTAKDMADEKLADKLKLCSDSFKIVNLETGDRLEGITPTDLLDDRSKRYVEEALNNLVRIKNHGILVIHLAGGCKVLEPSSYSQLDVRQSNKFSNLKKCLKYIRGLDPENKLIALENTFPTDWMDEDNGIISFYSMGKLASDFEERIMTFDTGHAGVTAYTYANSYCSPARPFGFFDHNKFGKIPVIFLREEREFKKLTKTSLTHAVCEELKKSNSTSIHLNNSRGLLDGFGMKERGNLNFMEIMSVINEKIMKNPNFSIVTEVKERTTGDYLNAPNQKEMIEFIFNYFN